MKTKLKYILTIIAVLLMQTFSFAQDATSANKSAIDNFMNSNGKVFVVVAVVFVIVLGLFIYLFSLDKKMARLESEIEK